MIYEAIDRWNTPSLLHYGVKGMKWGIRHDRVRSGRKRRNTKEDVIVPKGHIFYRVYSADRSSTGSKEVDNRVYVSDNAADYLSDDAFIEGGTLRIMEIRTKSEMKFAGEDAINDILKKLNQEPLAKPGTTKGTDRDFFMRKDYNDLSKKFIQIAKQRGYSGVRDPVDDLERNYSYPKYENATQYSAKILFNYGSSNYKKLGDFSMNEFLGVR